MHRLERKVESAAMFHDEHHSKYPSKIAPGCLNSETLSSPICAASRASPDYFTNPGLRRMSRFEASAKHNHKRNKRNKKPTKCRVCLLLHAIGKILSTERPRLMPYLTRSSHLHFISWVGNAGLFIAPQEHTLQGSHSLLIFQRTTLCL